MGASLSACFRPPSLHVQPPHPPPRGHEWSSSLLHDPLDETLGHSFCYLPSSNRFLLHSPSDSLRFDRPTPASYAPTLVTDSTETALFKSISGASVGANASVPPSVTALRLHNPPDYAEDHSLPLAPASGFCSGGGLVRGNVFEGTSSFRAVELQPVPRGEDGFFLSGPIERGAMSGPLVDGWPDRAAGPHIHFSAPLGGAGGDHGGMPGRKRRRRKKRGGVSGIRNSLAGGFAEKKWVVPVRSFSGSKEAKEREIVGSINFVEGNGFACIRKGRGRPGPSGRVGGTRLVIRWHL